MSREDVERMIEQFRRFASKRQEEPSISQVMPIKLLDDEVSFKLHWISPSRAQSIGRIGRILHVEDFPKCPSCYAECCLGHPDNGCEMCAVWDVSES